MFYLCLMLLLLWVLSFVLYTSIQVMSNVCEVELCLICCIYVVCCI